MFGAGFHPMPVMMPMPFLSPYSVHRMINRALEESFSGFNPWAMPFMPFAGLFPMAPFPFMNSYLANVEHHLSRLPMVGTSIIRQQGADGKVKTRIFHFDSEARKAPIPPVAALQSPDPVVPEVPPAAVVPAIAPGEGAIIDKPSVPAV